PRLTPVLGCDAARGCTGSLSVTGFITTVSPYGHPRGGIANLCPESGHMRVDDQQNPGGKPGRLFVIVVRIPIPEPDERQQRAGRIILDVLVRRSEERRVGKE